MMKEEKGNIEQMSERLFHYLRKRESSASQEAEDEYFARSALRNLRVLVLLLSVP